MYDPDGIPEGATLPPIWEWFVLLGSLIMTAALFLFGLRRGPAVGRARLAVARLRASAWRDGYGP